MEDILITDIKEFEEITDFVIIDKDVPVSVDDINRKEIIEGGEFQDKSDVSILGSNAINNNRSSKNVDLSHFDVTSLWNNSNPDVSIGNSSPITFTDSILNYDLIGVRFKYVVGSEANLYSFVDPKQTLAGSNPAVNLNCSSFGGSALFDRNIYIVSDSQAYIQNVSAGSSYNSYSVPVEIIGLNFKEISNSPDIPVSPSVSGNVVNNYYISLSGNGVSYNLIDKPLNEFTPTESMFALSILFALGIGFVILCRKAVFRWK